MIKVKILKAKRGAKYKKGDILLVDWAFCNQYGGKEYYHNDRFSWVIPGTENPFVTFIQEIPKEHCKVLNYNFKPKKRKNDK